MNSITISVPKWETYNPRNDRKNTIWLRLQSNFFSSYEVFALSPAAKLLTVALFCEICRSDGKEITVPVPYAAVMTGLTHGEITSAVDELLKTSIFKIASNINDEGTCAISRQDANMKTGLGRLRYERTNDTNVTNERTCKQENLELGTLPVPAGPSPITQIKKAFTEAFEKEFGHKYVGWGIKENSQAKAWLKSVSLEDAVELCRIYPGWNDEWVTKQGHTFGILVSQYQRVNSWHRSPGKLVKKIAVGKAEETVVIKRAIQEQEQRRDTQLFADERRKHHDRNRNPRGVENISKQLQNTAEVGLLEDSGDPFGQHVFADTGDPNAQAGF